MKVHNTYFVNNILAFRITVRVFNTNLLFLSIFFRVEILFAIHKNVIDRL